MRRWKMWPVLHLLDLLTETELGAGAKGSFPPRLFMNALRLRGRRLSLCFHQGECDASALSGAETGSCSVIVLQAEKNVLTEVNHTHNKIHVT